ncbi:hypothetical protein MTR67_003298 [Solanum verrucosum]|uniref:Uncharacterized protein n=1 Tax=Solanum verrucosum TaxID=315347 RepID=A0AAF0PRW0_SOLVR|nr:hypothetical protein MTR67_003298 [Solanum verrucosum]
MASKSNNLKQLILIPSTDSDDRQQSINGVNDANKVLRLPRWIKQEILVLIQGRKVVEDQIHRARTRGLDVAFASEVLFDSGRSVVVGDDGLFSDVPQMNEDAIRMLTSEEPHQPLSQVSPTQAGICAKADHSASLVGITDQLNDLLFGVLHRRLAPSFSIVVLWVIGSHGTASRNFSVMRRLLPLSTGLILSFRALHTGTKGEV